MSGKRQYWRTPERRAIRDAVLDRQFAEARRRKAEIIDRDAILARDGHTCRYCGATGVRLAVDHLVPFSRGGSSDPSNLVAACKSCNSRKKDRTPEEAGMPLRPLGDQ